MTVQECSDGRFPASFETASDRDVTGPCSPASLRVFRYRPGDADVRAIIGSEGGSLPQEEVVAHASEALGRRTFMFYTVAQYDDADAHELCFVPKGSHCDILSIHTHGWHRRGSDARRSLLDVLSDLAAAVACGTLAILDCSELAAELEAGEEVLTVPITGGASLAVARETADISLRQCGIGDEPRDQAVLALSEAATNILLHGGGQGHIVFRLLHDRLRFVVADRGTGLSFRNWRERHYVDRCAVDRPFSMGYGFKIMLDHLDAVGLHSGPWGTTLVLDRIKH